MKQLLIILFLFFSFSGTKAQSVDCDDLTEFIEDEGYPNGSLNSIMLQSSWLYKVTGYSYDYKIYVVAEIKENEYSYRTTKYIFCGIPARYWNAFRYPSYGDTETYGQRFHRYIIDYKCDCDWQ